MTDETPAAAPAASTTARVATWLGIAVAALIGLVAIVLLGLNTGPGRAFLARQISGFEMASGLAVRVGGIDGSIYGRMTLRGLEVRDPQGVFLTAPAITVDWRPFAYINGRIDVRELAAGSIRLMRLPALRETPSDPNAPLLPDIDLSVGRLAIDRFIVEPAVTGQRHILGFRGTADIADGRARLTADAAAMRAAGVAGGDRLRLRLDAVPDANRLLIDAALDAPAGGLVDSFTKQGKPIQARVNGRGDWANWTGAATATLASEKLVGLDIGARNGRFRIVGDARPGIMLSGPAARLTRPAIAIEVDATLSERRLDTVVKAHSDALAVEAKGLIDLGQSRFGNVRIDTQLLTPGAIADNVVGRNVRFGIVLDGPFATPTIDYAASATTIGFGETLIEGVRAEGRAVVDADRIMVPLHAVARRVSGLNAAAGGLLTNLRIDGDLAISGGRAVSDNLRLRSDRIDATAIVIADTGTGRYTGALKGRVNDYQVDGLGRLNLTTDAELVTGPNGGFGIKGRVRVVTSRLDNASVRDFLGGNAVTTADIGFDENGVATVNNLRVDAPGFRLRDGRGSYRPDGRIAFRAAGVSRQYGPLQLEVAGTVARPVARLRAARPDLGAQLSNVEAVLTGTAAGYEIRATGGSAYGPFSANVLVANTAGPLAVDIRAARFAGIDLRGRLVQTGAGPFAGTLLMNGSGLSGTARLSAAGANQRADLDLAAQAARLPSDPPITIGSGLVRASIVLLPAGPSVTGDARLSQLRQGDFAIDNARARITYAGGRGQVDLVADGRSGVPFRLAGRAALTPELIRANVTGSANGLAFRLARPAEIRQTADGWQLAPARLLLPQGAVDLSGRFGTTTEAQARLQAVDLSLVQAIMPGLGLGGKASGTVDYRASGRGVPTARARIDIDNFTRTGAASVSDPVDIALLGTLSDAGGDMRALVRRGGDVLGRVQARLAPLPGSGEAWTERLMAAPLSGGIRYNGPAAVLWSLTGIADQELTGPIAIAADFGGRLSQPRVNGIIHSTALRYENQTYGTVLSNIVLQGRFTQSRLMLEQMTARAGDGSITGSGYVGLEADAGFPMDLRLVLQHAQLARSDALGATVSGNLAITNSRAAGALIKGDINIPEARYQIIRQPAAEIATLEGVRRRGAPPPAPAEQGATSIPGLWKLDIRVRADNRLYVSGMGLESEWRSDLRVGGTSSNPVVTGTLEVVRGTYSFAGRRFDLTSGNVTFEGGALTNPQIAISAETTVEGVTAIINITGRAQNPQIAFTSTPTLPQDEVLSRLLFGSSVTSLSPTQALQLAAALNSLRGSGGGLNPLGKLRSATGIDRLRILGADQATGRGTALAAGQYISNDIYIEVITDARGFTATQLEIAISKALSILSSTGSFGGSNVNLRYSKDY